MNVRSNRTSQGRKQYKWLLLSTVAVMVSMAVPEPLNTTRLSYSALAIVMTQVILRNEQAPRLAEQIYQALGAVAVVSLWISWLAPEGMIYSGVPIILSWGMLVGWSTLRLIRRLAREPLVDAMY